MKEGFGIGERTLDDHARPAEMARRLVRGFRFLVHDDHFAHGNPRHPSCSVQPSGASPEGYGFAVITNSDSGGRLSAEVEARIAAAYNWDSVDKPVPR
jgi:hypothetical protein